MQCGLFPRRVNIHVVMINITHWLGALSSQTGDREQQCVPLALDGSVSVYVGKQSIVIGQNDNLWK